MRTKLFVVGTALALMAIAAPLLAHHSFSAEYDATKPVQMEGTVTKVEWMNPHVYFYIDVKNEAAGKIVNWACEMGSPNALQRQGWTRNTIQIGMKVAFEGTLAKDGSPKTNARNVTVDGKRLGAASSEGVTP
jgi:Family of unknown function (DUF6152)